MKKLIALVALAGAASLAHADYTFSPFDLFDVGQTNVWNNNAGGAVALTGAPAATYVGWRVNFNWDSNPNGTSSNHAWSNEARIQLASASGTGTSPTYPCGTTLYSAIASASNGAGNASDVASLNFAGPLSTVYNGSGPLFFNYRQTFASTINDVDWRGISVTLIEAVRPTCINLGNIGGATLNFNTEGTAGGPAGVDTEVAVYDNNGNFLGTDDDGGTNNLSSLNLAALPDGTYYIAVGMFNTVFGQGWGATSTGPATTGVNLNVTNGVDTLTSGAFDLAAGGIGWYCITIPTPSAAALLGLGGLIAARRRRA
jgi:hypothetical protein